MPARARPASFDSATAMVRATAGFLAGGTPPLPGAPGAARLRPLLAAANHLPLRLRRLVYAAGSGREALSPEVVAGLRADDLALQMVARYGPGPYQGAVVGAATGSLVHLGAAFALPLLPQTLLVPLRRRSVSPDDPAGDLAASRGTVRALLRANPDLVCHQMFDPNSDRLTLRWFSYLRLKRTVLGAPYEDFLARHLAPGATILVAECRHRWPTTGVGERHVFQLGGVGALPPEEYHQGSARVAAFLAAQGSDRRGWDAPAPDGERPEAEWGFEPALADDVERFAAGHGFRVRRIAFDEADDLSPLVADLYRWWYARRGQPVRRLFVESFVLVDPWGVLRAGAVPYWVTFNTEAAAAAVATYLQRSEPFGRLDLTLVSNGTESVGLASVAHWREVLDRAARLPVRLSGVDPTRYPADLAVFARYADALRSAPHPLPVPQPLPLPCLDDFLASAGPRYRVSVGSP